MLDGARGKGKLAIKVVKLSLESIVARDVQAVLACWVFEIRKQLCCFWLVITR
jgi:hypothetical protein